MGRAGAAGCGPLVRRPYAGEPLATLPQVADFCLQRRCFINLEIKPPLLSSFDADALCAARQAAPTLPRALVLERLRAGWLQQCLDLRCAAVVGEYPLWSEGTVASARCAGLRVLSYTVNDPADADRLLALGTQGVVSDCLPCLQDGC